MVEISKQHVRNDLNNFRFGKNSYVVIEDATLGQLYSRMLKKDFGSSETVILEHKNYLYIDDIVKNNSKCEEFEKFVFDVLENQLKKTGFLYLSFKLHTTTLQELIDTGVCEWFEYMMMFLKFSRLNILLQIEDCDINDFLPIAYQVVKKINNPRLSLYCNISGEQELKLPEDVNTVTKVVGDNMSTEKFVYSEFKIV